MYHTGVILNVRFHLSYYPTWVALDTALLYPLRVQVNGSLQVRMYYCDVGSCVIYACQCLCLCVVSGLGHRSSRSSGGYLGHLLSGSNWSYLDLPIYPDPKYALKWLDSYINTLIKQSLVVQQCMISNFS